MVRKPKAADTESSAPKDPRARIVAALMALAAERDFDDITIADITETAGLGLADFREAFPSKGAVLAGFARQTDLAVLRGTGADMADEPAKDRLFDVLMRRLDALAPHKAADMSTTAILFIIWCLLILCISITTFAEPH